MFRYPFNPPSLQIMPQSDTVTISALHAELQNLFDKADKTARQIHASESKKYMEFSKEKDIKSHAYPNISLKIIVGQDNNGESHTSFHHLQFNNLRIKVDEIFTLKIRTFNNKGERSSIVKGERSSIVKVTFNNVIFANDYPYKDPIFHIPFILDVCNNASVELIGSSIYNAAFQLICGPKDGTVDNFILDTKVLINGCIMQNFIMRNASDMGNSKVRILNSVFTDAEIYYEQREEDGKCDIEINESSFKNLIINMQSDAEFYQNEKHERKSNRHQLFALISGNIIETLKFNFPTIKGYDFKAKIVNANQITFFRVADNYPDITAWGLHESIGEGMANNDELAEARKNIESNKEVLVKLKQQANDKGDRFQESTINYHVTSCDEQLISLEENKEFWQEKLIMQLGRLLSKHGTSWIRPLFGIVISNAVFGSIIYAIAYFLCPENIGVSHLFHTTGQLLNPLTTSLDVVVDIDSSLKESYYGSIYLLIYFLVAVSKGFYAMCVYEFVRAARRFTIK